MMDNKLSFPVNRNDPKTIGSFLFIPSERQEVIEEYISEIVTDKVPQVCEKLLIAYGHSASEFAYALYCLGAYREQEDNFEEENSFTLEDTKQDF